VTVGGAGPDRPAEVLDAGPRGCDARPRRAPRSRLRPALAVTLIGCLAVAGLVADRQAGRTEFDRLLSRCADAHATAGYAQAQLSSVIAYATPLLQRPTGPPGVPEGLTQLVQQAARRSAAELLPPRTALARADVLPWHTTLRAARGSCLAYTDAVRARWLAYAADLQAGYAREPDVPALLQTARTALTAAAPDDAARRRVASALADGRR
jgi:hypothetical protein